MVSHLREVLRQGLWASLSGGWFYDPHLSHFSNVFHLYMWLFFLLVPFSIHLSVHEPYRYIAWVIYTVFVTLLVIIIKVISFQLHKLFDTGEQIEADSNYKVLTERDPSNQVEQIELQNISSIRVDNEPPASPPQNTDILTPDEPDIGVDLEVPIVQINNSARRSLEDIRSIEEITSLEDLKDDDDNKKISELRRTIKAMSTQVTPQTSPLMLKRRRAISQERWPAYRLTANTGICTPPSPFRGQPRSQSARYLRRRNARRTKSVPDSPTGSHSHMLVSESRAEDQQTLEWAGYPHPSPRPRLKHRHGSHEEPLHSHNRRYSLDLKSFRQSRSRRPSAANSVASSDVLLRSDSKREEDLKHIREKLLRMPIPERKISTESEPVSIYITTNRALTEEQLTSSDDSLSENEKTLEPTPRITHKRHSLDETQKNRNNSAKITQRNTEESGSDRPRNPTPTAASASTWVHNENTGEKLADKGAIPKRKPPTIGDIEIREQGEQQWPRSGSQESSLSGGSGSENTALLNVRLKSMKNEVTTEAVISTEPSTIGDQESEVVMRPKRSDSQPANPTTSRQRHALVMPRSWGRFTIRRRTSTNQSSTSDAAVAVETNEPEWHYFQDELGCWYKYTFTPGHNQAAINLGTSFVPPSEQREPDNVFGETEEAGPSTQRSQSLRSANERNLSSITEQFRSRRLNISDSLDDRNFDRLESQTGSSTLSLTLFPRDDNTITNQPKKFYRWKILNKFNLKIWLDRLSLLSLIDRNVAKWENVLSVILSFILCVSSAVLLSHSYFNDIWILFFCFVLAGCHYSLIKSVQPDAASPTHGYNNVIVYSRAFYFVLLSVILISADYLSRTSFQSLTVYSLIFGGHTLVLTIQQIIKVIILCLPLIFTLGLLPQVTTFLQYLLEQIDLHIFGGNGTSSLLSSLVAVIRSCIAVGILYGFACIPIKTNNNKAVEITKSASTATAHSAFIGIMVAMSYHLSRQSSDVSGIWIPVKSVIEMLKDKENGNEESSDENLQDPLPKKIRNSLILRLKHDAVVCVIVAIFVFAIHASTVFVEAQPSLHNSICYITIAVGFILHYIMSQMRKEYPWLCCNKPILETYEREQFNIRDEPVIRWFEKVFTYLRQIERCVLYPVVFISAITVSTEPLYTQYGIRWGPVILVICGVKCLRSSFSDTSYQYCVLSLTMAAINYDMSTTQNGNNTFILNYAIMLIFYSKFYDFFLKMKFIFQYIVPWQLAWGSSLHAFAQPLSIPHSVMLFVQAIISSLLYTPLNPFLGSAIFLNSYMRPIKFWEKDYNTKRVDHSNIRLAQQVENSLNTDDNNLNSIFYEHLTRSLQKSLSGDLTMGRWGNVTQGDMFIMASDYLNALVHIIEMGNGLVTFQLRGLEFRGTYCQQREVEAITEGVGDNMGFCCCNPGHCPHFLSLNAAFSQRWLSWQVAMATYVIEGYSISDNNAGSMLQVYDLRALMIEFYLQSVIYCTVTNPKLVHWLDSKSEEEVLSLIDHKQTYSARCTVTLETKDYVNHMKISDFYKVFKKWIQLCVNKYKENTEVVKPHTDTYKVSADSSLVKLLFCLCVVARRALDNATHGNTWSANVEFFLNGLHSLFKGDFRITGSDEWVFKDMTFLKKIISPAIRIALKCHQDHFTDEDASIKTRLENIIRYEEELVITHEADPGWRNAVLCDKPQLLALRHVLDDMGSDVYKIITLNKRFLSFRIIKVNRECVRGLWAGQQQELVFLRNRNPERGSIQNAKQALRNMINSSCDQPIGYPIYVSPLTTSYADTNKQLTSLIGSEITFNKIYQVFRAVVRRLRRHCDHACHQFPSQADIVGQQYHVTQGARSTATLRARSSSRLIKDGGVQETSFTQTLASTSTHTEPTSGSAKSGKHNSKSPHTSYIDNRTEVSSKTYV